MSCAGSRDPADLCHVHRYVLEKVDLVIVGAEGVVESGGIINKVCFRKQSSGTCPSAKVKNVH